MSYKLEVLYHEPPDDSREQRLATITSSYGGKLTCRELPQPLDSSRAICLTYEFSDYDIADVVATKLRNLGEHVEGPCDYGGD